MDPVDQLGWKAHSLETVEDEALVNRVKSFGDVNFDGNSTRTLVPVIAMHDLRS